MSITDAQVRWGSYLDFEGPWTPGVHKMPAVDAGSSLPEKTVAVIAATEGAAFDAVNMYDRCIMTVGCIQFCDGGQFSVCDLLGEVAETAPAALKELRAYVAKRGYSFDRTARGRWRFHGHDGEVDTLAEQRVLYLKSASGLRGGWDADSRAWARGFVVAMASVWDDPAARAAQLAFTYRKLPSFVFGPGADLFKDGAGAAFGLSKPELEAARAAYLSFATNMPAIASKQFDAWRKRAGGVQGTDWLVGLLEALTFGPKIAIYRGRYDKIAPLLRRFWDVAVPLKAADLGAAATPSLERLRNAKVLQRALIALGFDLGPKGADGIVGPKTRAAVVMFQTLHGLVPDGVVGPKTADALVRALRKAKQLDVLD